MRQTSSPRETGLIGLFFLFFSTVAPPLSGEAFAATSCASNDASSVAADVGDLKLDTEHLVKTVASGRVYQQRNFLTEPQVRALLLDIDDMRDSNDFSSSGLSNTIKGDDQNFGKADREVCPVPWWKDSLSGTSELIDKAALPEGEVGRLVVSTKIQCLRRYLSSLLGRPTMSDANLSHECYYSRSTPGAVLARHMDERHEETKGSRGWLLPSRRSISWLIYLSDPNWNIDVNGGQLRSFPQEKVHTVEPGWLETGCHDGNLQIGWLADEGTSSLPVFLDSWYKARSPQSGNVEPHCILYVVRDTQGHEIEYITRPWVNDSVQGASAADFVKTQANLDEQSPQKFGKGGEGGGNCLFMRHIYAKQFHLIEDRDSWLEGHNPFGSTIDEVVPERGSLILFDSVSVPHEVMLVKVGTRAALAGWFHEETQPFPESMYE